MERLAGHIMLQWGWRRALTAFAAGAFAVLALPPFDFFAAMFVSFPVLVWLLDGASGNPDRGAVGRLWPAFATGWCFGFGYFTAGLWWLGGALLVEADSFAWVIPFAVLGLPAALAIFFGFGTAFARLFWSDGFGRLCALAAGLTVAEWLRGMLFTGFPWNTIGYGAMPMPLMMQSAHAIGLLGVTALAILVFCAPALIGTRHGARPGLAVAAILAAAHLGYGYFVLNSAPAGAQIDPDAAVVRLVQPSIAQTSKWDEASREDIFERHLSLTSAEPAEGAPVPDLVVWAETSVPYILTETPEALRRMADALSPGQLLAAGAVRVDNSQRDATPRYYNSITVVDDNGQIVGAADKVHLVPFGEYLPFQSWFDALGIGAIAATQGSFSAGAERRPMSLGETIRALPLICYEAIFPIETEGFGDAPGMLLNVTNDAWYGDTPGPYQHFRQAQLRAVEARTPLVRAANNGISAVTDGYGRIVDGLALDAIGFIDVAIPARPVPQWSTTQRNMNLWLIIGILSLAAMIARSGLFRR